MEVILTKLKWDENPELDDADEDDIAEFEKMRKVGSPFLTLIISLSVAQGIAGVLGFSSCN